MEYFLGCASPEGFKSSFSEMLNEYGYYAYILKGGPGTGKSTLMKKVIEAFPDEDADIYRCASDPKSLDAIVLPKRKVIFVDGTSPHIAEPKYPGVSGEIINLGSMWDREKITPHKDALICCYEENATFHSCARRFICAYSALVADVSALSIEGMLKNKCAAFGKRFSAKHFGNGQKTKGKLIFRQLSAITSQGYKTIIPQGYEVILIRDDYFAVADFLLREFSVNAVSAGNEVIVSPLRLQGQSLFEHLLLPDKKLAIMSAGWFSKVDCPESYEINSLRFYNRKNLSEKKRKLSFCRRAATELRAEAANSIAAALEIHDIIEGYYIPAMDFDALDTLTEKLIEKIK